MVFESSMAFKNASLRSKIMVAKSEELETKEYEPINYDEYLQMIPSLEENKNMVKSYVLEDLYPQLVKNKCGQTDFCQTKMFEIVNHSLGYEQITSMPTILIIGGFHGTENTGIRIITSMILLLQKMYTSIRDWYNMLNTVRILAIPVINMQGFYNQVDYEERKIDGKKFFPNPKIDYNLQTNQSCFVSLSAQFLAMIHEDNIIYGSLLFNGSSFDIDYPRLKDIFPTYQENSDDFIYQDVAKVMTNLFNKHKPDNAPKMTLDSSTGQTNNYKNVNGTYYQEWAYASSSYKNYVSKSCIPKGSVFAQHYENPGENTLRSFVINISINTKDVKRTEKTKKLVMKNYDLGNELYVINPNHKKAKSGLVSAGIILINQFTKIMKPFSLVSNVTLAPKDENEYFKNDFNFDFVIKGCLTLTKISIIDKPPTEQKQRSFIFNSETIFKNEIKTRAIYKKNDFLNSYKPLSFRYSINCNQHFAQYVSEYEEPTSLFGKAQTNSDLHIQNNEWTLKSTKLDKGSLKNLILNKIDEMLIQTKFAGASVVFYQMDLPIQVGTFFPFNLKYDRNSGIVDFDLNISEIPSMERMIKNADHTVEFGTSNSVRNAQNNAKFVEIMNLLRNIFENNIKLYIYNSYNDFIKSEIHLKNLHRFRDSHVAYKQNLSQRNSRFKNKSDKDRISSNSKNYGKQVQDDNILKIKNDQNLDSINNSKNIQTPDAILVNPNKPKKNVYNPALDIDPNISNKLNPDQQNSLTAKQVELIQNGILSIDDGVIVNLKGIPVNTNGDPVMSEEQFQLNNANQLNSKYAESKMDRMSNAYTPPEQDLEKEYNLIEKELRQKTVNKLSTYVEHYFNVKGNGDDIQTYTKFDHLIYDFEDPTKQKSINAEQERMSKNKYYIQFDKKIDDYMLPSAYMDLLGRPVTIAFKFNNMEQVEQFDSKSKNLFKSLNDSLHSHLIQKINGMIIKIDEDITGLLDNHQNQKKDFPSDKEISQMKEKGDLLVMPQNGLMCTSVMPYLPVYSQNLPHLVYLIKNNKRIYHQQKHFYTLTIIPKIEDKSLSIVSFYIRNKVFAESYVLKHKNLEYVLKLSDRILQMDGILGSYSKEIKIYQGVFPTKSLKLTGVYLNIYPQGSDKSIFDCFTNSNYQGVDIKNLFMTSIAISEEQKMIKHLILTHEYQQTWSYFFISMITSPIFLTLVIGLFFFGLYLIIRSNISSNKTKEMVDPLQDVANHEDVIRTV